MALKRQIDIDEAVNILATKRGTVFYVDLEMAEVYEISPEEWLLSGDKERKKNMEYLEKAADIFAILKE